MREILFRGKRVDNGEWVMGFLVKDTEFYGKPESHTYIINHKHPSGCYGHDIFLEVDPATVGQYTGLTDKNGKRIFEGDIVFAKDDILGSPFADGIKGKVVYCETAFFIEPKNVMDTEWLFNECADYEIIGNIHDNPELLKDELSWVKRNRRTNDE